ncbi:hypothetical protein D3C85_1719210 [compost metagenome]
MSPVSVARRSPFMRCPISASSCIRLCSQAFIVEARFAMVSTPFLYVYPPNWALQPSRMFSASSVKLRRSWWSMPFCRAAIDLPAASVAEARRQ